MRQTTLDFGWMSMYNISYESSGVLPGNSGSTIGLTVVMVGRQDLGPVFSGVLVYIEADGSAIVEIPLCSPFPDPSHFFSLAR